MHRLLTLIAAGCTPAHFNCNYTGNAYIFYIFDIWKMKVVTMFRIGDKNSVIRCMDINYEENHLYLIDQDNKFYCFQLGNYGADKYNSFDEYKKDRTKYKMEIYQCKLQQLAAFQLDGLEPPTHMHYSTHNQFYEPDDNIMTVIYEKKICYYHKPDFQSKLTQLIAQEKEDASAQEQQKQEKAMNMTLRLGDAEPGLSGLGGIQP